MAQQFLLFQVELCEVLSRQSNVNARACHVVSIRRLTSSVAAFFSNASAALVSAASSCCLAMYDALPEGYSIFRINPANRAECINFIGIKTVI